MTSFPCQYCDRTFDYRENRSRHFRDDHRQLYEEKKKKLSEDRLSYAFGCDICSRRYKTKGNLFKHLKGALEEKEKHLSLYQVMVHVQGCCEIQFVELLTPLDIFLVANGNVVSTCCLVLKRSITIQNNVIFNNISVYKSVQDWVEAEVENLEESLKSIIVTFLYHSFRRLDYSMFFNNFVLNEGQSSLLKQILSSCFFGEIEDWKVHLIFN